MFSEFVNAHHPQLKTVASAIRVLGMDAVLKAKSGHVGLPLGGAEMASLLYFGVMKYNPTDSQWPNRDRFVLSAGHGSMLQYSCLHLAGFGLSLDEIKNFRQLGSQTPGHPEFGHTKGVECTTGPLGQGIANAVGMALAERWCAAQFNDDTTTLCDHRTYVILGDGCMMEGVSHEACSLAGHLKLNRLIALYDANNITIDGTIDISFSENVGARFEAYGWNVIEADAHDFVSLAGAMDIAYRNSLQTTGQTGPSLIVCKSIAGKGSPKWEGKPKIHGNPMSAEDVVDAKKHLGFADNHSDSFFVLEQAQKAASELTAANQKEYQAWHTKLTEARTKWKSKNDPREALWAQCFEENKNDTIIAASYWAAAKDPALKPMSTRVASGKALVELSKTFQHMVGGSADLAGSNCTTLPDSKFMSRTDFSGRNIHFGVREHGMAAISNGMALHGGVLPYCATFAVFADYLRPSLRLSALMNIPVTYILTHDSYAVGEDGPTHQPIEHAWALRAIPNLNTLRPADSLETFAAWENTMKQQGPTALLLTRQDVPDLDTMLDAPRKPEIVAKGMSDGAYLLKDFCLDSASTGALRIVLIASGSEVSLALSAAKEMETREYKSLEGETIKLNIRVVSCPAPQKLVMQPSVLSKLVPSDLTAIAIEAGATTGWGEIVGRSGAVFGLNHFGASAPAGKLAEYFGLTNKGIEKFVLNTLRLR